MNTLLKILSWFMALGFVFVVGMGFGSWQTYSHMVNLVEERVVRDANYTMAEAGVKKYRFQTNDGRVKLIIRAR